MEANSKLRPTTEPSLPVIVVVESSEGRLRADASFCPTAAQRSAAFLAAAMNQARNAWDESPKIRIECGERVVEVAPRFDGKRWQAALF
jgi:hypothetical protein